jgi:16S rRNA G966 N2-methylase RsmD
VIQLSTENRLSGSGRYVVDSIRAAFVSDAVILVDCDPEAVAVTWKNAESVEVDDTIHFVHAKVHTKSTPNKRAIVEEERAVGEAEGVEAVDPNQVAIPKPF